MKTRLLIIVGLVGLFLVPMNFAQGLPVFLDCTYDSDFIISTNKLEFVPDETFVLDVKTSQNDTSFEIIVMNPKGQDETPQSQLSIKPLFINHKYKVEDASFLIAGESNTDVQVKVLDHNTEKTHIYIIPLTPEGKCSFTLDLDGYKPGVYDVEISDHNHDVTTMFTVGMQPTTGHIAVNLFSDSYFFGDDVYVSIETPSEIDLSIEVMDPSGNIVNQFDATSEKNGIMHTSVDLPEFGEDGIWSITAKSGANFDTIEFDVSQNIQGNSHPRTPGGSVSPDRTVYPVPWEDRPPLQQFKDGIRSDVIHCNDSLVLIQKYDGTPACVKKKNFDKLIQRNWGQPISYNNLAMTDALSDVYLPGMPISFKVTETGWGNTCNSMLLSIINLDTNEIVWDRSERHPCFQTPPEDFFIHVSYVPDSRVSELSFEDTGDYKLKIESRNKILEHYFSVKLGEKENEN